MLTMERTNLAGTYAGATAGALGATDEELAVAMMSLANSGDVLAMEQFFEGLSDDELDRAAPLVAIADNSGSGNLIYAFKKVRSRRRNNKIAVAWAVVGTASMAASAYHGYKRNQSVGWALVWALLGGLAPVITPTIAVAQGFGKRK